jgi:hypothetical protein
MAETTGYNADANASGLYDDVTGSVGHWFGDWFCGLTFGYGGECEAGTNWFDFGPGQWAFTIFLLWFIWTQLFKRG